jgi:hypothetical protein
MDYIESITEFQNSSGKYTIYRDENVPPYNRYYELVCYGHSIYIDTAKDISYVENDDVSIIIESGDYDSIYYYNKKEKLITHMYQNNWDWDTCEMWVLNDFIGLI